VAAKPDSQFQQEMDRLQAEYEIGDKGALVLALRACAICLEPMPLWVAKAWMGGWLNVVGGVADWNALLGDVKVKTPKQIARRRRDQERLIKLGELLPFVHASIERDSGGAFEELGKKMGISARAVRELFYRKVKANGKSVRLIDSTILGGNVARAAAGQFGRPARKK
jgi:hypothetical protein